MIGSMVLSALGPHSPPVSTMSREVKSSLAEAEMNESRAGFEIRGIFCVAFALGWRSIRHGVFWTRSKPISLASKSVRCAAHCL